MGVGIAAVVACGPRERPVSVVPPASPVIEDASAPPELEPSPYTVAASWGPSATKGSVALGKSETGLLVEGVRVVTNGQRMRVAADVATQALTGAVAVPERLGGGFVFHNETALYHAPSFDGKLSALAYFPEAKIVEILFAFDRAFVRSSDGQRWMIRVPSGERVSVEPPGLVDFVARDDGLGVALIDAGRLLATRDAGKSWQDVTSQLRGAPTGLAGREDAIYVTTAEGSFSRLGPDARMSRVDQIPAEPKRERDLRWRAGEPPLRAAIRAGVSAEDPGIALVASMGDLVRVSLRSGEIVSIQSGKLPPDGTCEGVRTPEDALFLCTRHVSGQERFVVSGTLYGKAPHVEQTFAGNLAFSVGDDGAIAYPGPCSGPPREGVACVRGASGSWLERAGQADAGAPNALGYVVPRADGTAVGLSFVGKFASIVDLVTGDVRTFSDGELPGTSAGRTTNRSGILRRDWSFSPDGTLLGWLGGKAVVIPPVGAPSTSIFVGDSAVYGVAGPRALGMTPTGRLYQTVDHGGSWVEVAPPPSQSTASDAVRTTGNIQCTELGCLLGPWLRVGYPDDAPRPAPRRVQVPPPSEVKPFASAKLFACETTGPVRGKSVPPDKDLGFGASFAPNGVETSVLGRASLHPVNQDASENDEPAKRAVSFAPSDVFRHTVTYVAPFDPLAAPRTGVLGSADVARAVITTGQSVDDLLSSFSLARAVPITPVDPASAGGLLFSSERVFFVFRGGARVFVLPDDQTLTPISAAELPGDELAVLVTNGTQSTVHRVSRQGGPTTVMTWSSLEDTERYPQNPDAVAIGPRGEIGVIRLASGSEPASERDPARLLLPKGKEGKLAPWSTLVPADDPACKADPSGFRATLQAQDWVKLDDAGQRPEAPWYVLARVRWGEARVCLEGLEVRMRGTEGDHREQGRRYEQWVVHRVLPTPQTGLVAVGSGFEFRQAARCTLR